MNDHKITLSIIALIAMVSTPAISSPTPLELEVDALSRLRTQLIRLSPKIEHTKQLKNISRQSFDYRALEHDKDTWVNLITSYLQLTGNDNFDEALDYAITNNGYGINSRSYRNFAQLSPNSNFIDPGNSQVERDALMNLRTLISRMKPLIREAESFSTHDAKVFFKYEALFSEHTKWLKRIDQYLASEIIPSEIEQDSMFSTTRGIQ